MTITEITRFLHGHLPLTAAMGITAQSYDGTSLTLAAPLRLNLNNSETAFGGSISTLAITSGWMMLHLLLERAALTHRLVIQKSTVNFQRPIDADFTAVTQALTAARAAEFVDAVRQERRGRITLISEIYAAQRLAATHEGTYVALAY